MSLTTAYNPGVLEGGDDPLSERGENPSVIFVAAMESLLFPTFVKLLTILFDSSRIVSWEEHLQLVSVSRVDHFECRNASGKQYKCWVRHCNISCYLRTNWHLI
jgi:hypothetical protein